MHVTVPCMRARIALALMLTCTQALADTPIAEVICAPRAEMVTRLAGPWASTLRATGLRDSDTVMEVWVSDRGRWTLVQSYANGLMCVLAMGEAWEMPENPA